MLRSVPGVGPVVAAVLVAELLELGQHLVLAVATLWVLAYGTRVEEARLRGLAPGCVRRPPLPPRSPRTDP